MPQPPKCSPGPSHLWQCEFPVTSHRKSIKPHHIWKNHIVLFNDITLCTYGTCATSWWRHALQLFATSLIKRYSRFLTGHPWWIMTLLNNQWLTEKKEKERKSFFYNWFEDLKHLWWLTILSFPWSGHPRKIIIFVIIHWLSTNERIFLVIICLLRTKCYKKNSQPPQGSHSVEKGRTWIQHDLQTKYNLSAFFLRWTLFVLSR